MSRSPEPPRPGTPRSPSESQGSTTLALRDEDFPPRTEALRGDLARRMRAWGGPVLARLRSAGISLTAHLFEDAGTQGIVFSGGTRTTLGLFVDADQVRAGLELSPARARAVFAALSSPERASAVETALEALPEQFVVTVEGDGILASAPSCTASALRAMLERAGTEGRRLWIGWTVPRPVAVSHAALLDEQLTDSLVVLAPMLSLLGGTSDDVPPGARSPSADRKRRGPRRTDDDGDRAGRAARNSTAIDVASDGNPDQPARSPSRRDRDAHLAPDPAPAPDRSGGRAGDPRAPGRLVLRGGRAKAGASLRSESSRRRHDVVERGAQVRVLEGPFAGKVGVVQEIDGRGGARVMMGLLAVRIDMTNLEVHVEGRRRPVLSTSHRKPVPVRS